MNPIARNSGILNMKIDLVDKWTLLNLVPSSFTSFLDLIKKNYNLQVEKSTTTTQGYDYLISRHVVGIGEIHIEVIAPKTNTDYHKLIMRICKEVSKTDNISEIAAFCLMTRNFDIPNMFISVLELMKNGIHEYIKELDEYGV